MITVENLSYSYPRKDLFNNISFTLENGQHCGFIGTSGSGKSTLVDMLIHPDNYLFDGKLTVDGDWRIGYISQFVPMDRSHETSVFEFVAEIYLTLQKQIEAICEEMATSSDIEPLMETYQTLLDTFDAIGGSDYENIIEKQLGLANLLKHKNLKIHQLSGGEFKLVQVIKEMLNRPELIVMDEPDVFLDFENLNGMRDLINAYKGTVLVITHNRYLLNHCFNKIIHLENTALQEFNGSYAAYTLSLLEKKIDLQERAMADDEEIERNQIIIDNLRKIATYNKEAARGKALKARVKFQERLEARRIQAPFVDIQKPTIRLTIDAPIEDGIVLSLNDFNLAFDETLLENATFEIGAKDKVALIGTNGCGKTTLIRKIYENKTPTITLSPEAKTAYLSQVQGEMMNESNTILEEFYYGGFDTSDSVRRHLLPYGFDSDKIKQEISTLSGGEKNLLQIAKASANQANLLLLDEPTSHLDTYSQMALEEAIADFNGAVLMISHDYYTIINSMDYVLLIEDKSIRKMSMRKFRKMIYANHFNKDYLHLEEKKQDLESKIAFALKNYNFEQAKVWCEKLEELIPLL